MMKWEKMMCIRDRDYSVYEIAEQLYNNCMMPTIDGHKYLYNTILTKVTPEYTEKMYK